MGQYTPCHIGTLVPILCSLPGVLGLLCFLVTTTEKLSGPRTVPQSSCGNGMSCSPCNLDHCDGASHLPLPGQGSGALLVCACNWQLLSDALASGIHVPSCHILSIRETSKDQTVVHCCQLSTSHLDVAPGGLWAWPSSEEESRGLDKASSSLPKNVSIGTASCCCLRLECCEGKFYTF